MAAKSKRMVAAKAAAKLPPLCEECGVNRSDPPSKLCPGCYAYKDHQQ